ncbi:uncharacterized protein LOC144159162 isoform X4 [Haemaphysalis longicornis]
MRKSTLFRLLKLQVTTYKSGQPQVFIKILTLRVNLQRTSDAGTVSMAAHLRATPRYFCSTWSRTALSTR